MKILQIGIILFSIVCIWSLSAGTPIKANWTEINSSAGFGPRLFQGGASFNNQLWTVGGYSNGTSFDDVWSSYDGNNWTLVTDQAEFGPRFGMDVTSFNGKLWVMGGSRNDGTRLNDVWSSDNGSNWTMITNHAAFSPRFFAGSAVFNNRLWIIGGSNTNDVWSSADGVNWTLETEHAEFTPRYGLGVVTYDNKIWTIGGMFSITDSQGVRFGPTSDVWSSPDGVTWTLINPSGFEPREFCPVAVYDNKIWIVGGGGTPPPHAEGYVPPTKYNSVWNSSDGKNWTLASSDPGFSPRFGQSVVEFDNTLWLFGGYDNSNADGKNDVWSYQSPNETLLTEKENHTSNGSIPIAGTTIPYPGNISNTTLSSTKAGSNPITSIFLILVIFSVWGYYRGKNL